MKRSISEGGACFGRARLTAVSLSVVALLGCVGAAPAAPRDLRGPWLLTALPSMGTVTWRCDPARERKRQPALALGINASTASATETVQLRAGGRTILRRTLQPGQANFRLPYLRQQIQQLTFLQATEPGTLRAVVTVNFSPRPISPSHCWVHLPPALTVRVYPR